MSESISLLEQSVGMSGQLMVVFEFRVHQLNTDVFRKPFQEELFEREPGRCSPRSADILAMRAGVLESLSGWKWSKHNAHFCSLRPKVSVSRIFRILYLLWSGG